MIIPGNRKVTIHVSGDAKVIEMQRADSGHLIMPTTSSKDNAKMPKPCILIHDGACEEFVSESESLQAFHFNVIGNQ